MKKDDSSEKTNESDSEKKGFNAFKAVYEQAKRKPIIAVMWYGGAVLTVISFIVSGWCLNMMEPGRPDFDHYAKWCTIWEGLLILGMFLFLDPLFIVINHQLKREEKEEWKKEYEKERSSKEDEAD